MKEASSQPFYVKFSSSKPLLHFRGPLPLGMGLCNWNLKFWKKKKKEERFCIHNGQKMETTPVSVDGRADGQSVVRSYNRTLSAPQRNETLTHT